MLGFSSEDFFTFHRSSLGAFFLPDHPNFPGLDRRQLGPEPIQNGMVRFDPIVNHLQNHYRKWQGPEVLLVAKALVDRQKNLKSTTDSSKKVPIGHARQSRFRNRRDRPTRQLLLQAGVNALV